MDSTDIVQTDVLVPNSMVDFIRQNDCSLWAVEW